MSPAIHYNGKEYAGREAMPPEVRADYERELHGQAPREHPHKHVQPKPEDDPADADDAVPGMPHAAPAWGGARPKGTVVVPAEFESVAGLGSAVSVHENETWMLPSFGPPRPKVMVRYRDGLAYQTHGKDIYTWRWDEVAAIQTNNEHHSAGEHTGSYTSEEYTLTKHSGEKVILDLRLKHLTELVISVKKSVYALIGPPLAAQYQSGQALTFGPVTIHKQNGMQVDGKLHAWDTIRDIKVENGQLKITLADGKKHNVRASAIPNVELLCQLIGLKSDMFDLTYWPGL